LRPPPTPPPFPYTTLFRSAGQRLPLRPVDLEPLLNDLYRQARRLALPRSQRVTLDATAPAVVAGDPDALRQLFLILVDNALTYSDRKTTRLNSSHVETSHA